MKKDGLSIHVKEHKIIYLKALLIEISVLAGAVFLFAAGMTLLESGFRYAALFATLAAALGAFAASFYLAGKIQKSGWLYGLIVGGVTFLVLTAVGLATSGGGLTVTTAFRFVILMLSSVIGGILGVGKADSHRYL